MYMSFQKTLICLPCQNSIIWLFINHYLREREWTYNYIFSKATKVIPQWWKWLLGWGHIYAVSCYDRVPQSGGFEQLKLITLKFWMLEVQKEVSLASNSEVVLAELNSCLNPFPCLLQGSLQVAMTAMVNFVFFIMAFCVSHSPASICPI